MKQIPEVVKTGGLAGQGIRNLLGRPRLGLLSLVLREAVQNSWDARKRNRSGSVRFSVKIRNLDPEEAKAFRKVFNQSSAIEPTRKNALAARLNGRGAIRVLELADFGTVGLSGPTRPDLPTNGIESRFVNFFFDFGRAHVESGDGGTYGFGRSSLYSASQASLIFVDSLTAEGGKLERRLMACRIGDAFEVRSGWKKGRYSGRHFWGRVKNDVAQPVTGQAAVAMADSLGLPKRAGAAHTGTTILIPWPAADFQDGDEIARALLLHLWPKMVPQTGQPTVLFEVEVDAQPYPVADPARTDEYRLFVQALKNARKRQDGPGTTVITTLRPQHTTGYLGLSEGIVGGPMPGSTAPDDEDDVEDTPLSALNQIALMRPSELVVRYLPIGGTESSGKSWAGVFICNDAEFVRGAFARAEPPAHDDWVANRLEHKHEKYIVRKTVQSLLPDAVRDALGVSILGGEGEESADGPSLAGVSARFSDVFLSGDGQGPSSAQTGPTGMDLGRPGNGAGRQARVSAPVPSGLAILNGQRIAKFRVVLQGRKDSVVTLRASPSVHSDGSMDSPPEGLRMPSVVGWLGGDADGNRCRVALAETRQDVEVHVVFNDEYGVALDCAIEDENE